MIPPGPYTGSVAATQLARMAEEGDVVMFRFRRGTHVMSVHQARRHLLGTRRQLFLLSRGDKGRIEVELDRVLTEREALALRRDHPLTSGR
jgi:hypothetical protein